jgi:hypothetical protein
LEFVRIGLEAAKGGVPDVLIWAGGSILALAAVTIPSLIAAQRPELAVATFVFSAIAVAWLGWLAAKNPRNFQIQRQWRVVQQPLRGEKLELMDKELTAVHNKAAEAVARLKSDTGIKDKVRANIFLADYRRAPEGIGCELRMPAQFRRRMDEPKEWDLAFQPGWGVTGEAFRSAQPVLTTDRLYAIPESLRDVFDQTLAADLKAVISMPILDDKNPNVLAVLNVDVREYEMEPKDLTAIYEELKRSTGFKNLCNLLNQLDKAWLTIGLRTG